MPHLVRNRTCGECSACCFTHGVATVKTKAGEWCQHCRIGHGCTIYADRPIDCRSYKCWWLRGNGKESDRPDKSGFISDGVDIPGQKAALIGLWEASPGGLETKPAKLLLEVTLDKGDVVCFHKLWPKSEMSLQFPWQMDNDERRSFIKAFNKHFLTTVPLPG